jgi:hypothetical protein
VLGPKRAAAPTKAEPSRGPAGGGSRPPAATPAAWLQLSTTPLDSATRAFFEPRLGHDLGDVRVHSDARADADARARDAIAYTVGTDVVVRPAYFAPATTAGRRLLGHELVHVVQQNGGTGAARGEAAAGTSDAFYESQAERISSTLVSGRSTDEAITPTTGTRVQRQAAGQSATTAVPTTPSAAEREAAVRGVRVRAPLEAWLREQGLDATRIDWAHIIPQLRASYPGGELLTLSELSDYYRYLFFLDLLARDVAGAAPPIAPAAPDIHGLQVLLILYVRNASVFSADIKRVYSESFLVEWADVLANVVFVPKDLRLEDLRMHRDGLAAERARALDAFLEPAAPEAVTRAILDEWTLSGLQPDEFLARLDLESYRAELIDALTKAAVEHAKSDPDYRTEVRRAAKREARAERARHLWRLGSSIQTAQRQLADDLLRKSLAEVAPSEWQIAENPARYVTLVQEVAAATQAAIRAAAAGQEVDDATLRAGLAAAKDLSPTLVTVTFWVEVASVLRGWQAVLGDEEREIRRGVAEWVAVSFGDVAAIVRGFAEEADRFVRTQWIPTLKAIALERIDAALGEIAKWFLGGSAYADAMVAKLRIGVATLEDIRNQLRDRQVPEVRIYDEVERREYVLRVENVEDLETTIKVMRARADQLESPEGRSKKSEELAEAAKAYWDVHARISDGTYSPLDYGKAVADEARSRLGMEWFAGPVTTGMALSRKAVAPRNPFLAYAITRWRFTETVAREANEFALMLGLGTLSLVAMIATAGAAAGAAAGWVVARVAVPGILTGAGVGFPGVVPALPLAIIAGVDIAAGLAAGWAAKNEASDLLDLARLDEELAGVTVEDARRALRHAWINLAAVVILTFGPAVFLRLLRFAKGRIGIARFAHLAAASQADAVRTAAMLRKVGGDAARLNRLLGDVGGDLARLESIVAYTDDIAKVEKLLAQVKHADTVNDLLIGARAGTRSAEKVLSLLDRGVTPLQLERMLPHASGIDEVATLVKGASPGRVETMSVLVGHGLSMRRLATAVVGAGELEAIAGLARRVGPSGASEAMALVNRGIAPARLEALLAKAQDVRQVRRLVDQLGVDRFEEVLAFGSTAADVERTLLAAGGDTARAIEILGHHAAHAERARLTGIGVKVPRLPTAEPPPVGAGPRPKLSIRRNVAKAALFIEGAEGRSIVSYKPALSGRDSPSGTLVGTGEYEAWTTKGGVPRTFDSEVKIFERAKRDLAARGIKDYRGVKLIIYSERSSCESCGRIQDIFEAEHPGITIELHFSYSQR